MSRKMTEADIEAFYTDISKVMDKHKISGLGGMWFSEGSTDGVVGLFSEGDTDMQLIIHAVIDHLMKFGAEVRPVSRYMTGEIDKNQNDSGI